MAIALPACRGDDDLEAVPPRADGNAAADDKVVWKKLKSLNDIVFWIELLEYSGNAIGTVALLGATVVLLGGFRSVLSPMDFWFAAVMIFMEGTRVFISKDTSVNQWLFGSTRAFRWDHFYFCDVHAHGNIIVMIIGVGISLVPMEFMSQITAGILKVAIVAITIQLLARKRCCWFAIAGGFLLFLAVVCGIIYGFIELESKHETRKANKKIYIMVYVWVFITPPLVLLRAITMKKKVDFSRTKGVLCLKVMVASGLVCLSLLRAKLLKPYRTVSLSIAAVLLTVNWPEAFLGPKREAPRQQEQCSRCSNALLLEKWELLLKILDTIMPILFFCGVMLPLPGISLIVSFCMLLSVIVAVLVGNLQIPVAFLQILLSILRLRSHVAGRDYHPLPEGASPNLVPSIIVFYALELCQGSSNILGVFLGLISFHRRRSLVRVLGFTKTEEKEWGPKAVNLYYHQACITIKENGLFPMEKPPPQSLGSFAVKSLGCTSSEMQIVRLHVLEYYLRPQADPKSKSKLIAQIAEDAKGIVAKIAGTISHLITDAEILISSGNVDKVQQIRSSLFLSLKLVRRLAIAGGKIGTRFRQELSGNPILLHSLQCICLDLEVYKQELWEHAADVTKLLALHDEATAKEIESTHAIIPKLMDVFLNRDDGRQAAGEVLVNLTTTSSDNCRTILDLEGGPAGRRELIKKFISMLQDDEYISVAANLLHNLYANCRAMLIDLDLDLVAKENLKSALRIMMQRIRNIQEGLMYAALHVASQIGYIIPKEDFAVVLAENLAPNSIANAAAEELVGKLVDTLNSNREPNREFPRLRRVLIEMVISIVEACPGYKAIFRANGMNEALNMLINTSSRLENYKVLVEGEGMVQESSTMQELVDKAKNLIAA